jgi:hypothetical protein
MFIVRFIKNLVLLVLIVAATLYIASYKVGGKTIQEHVIEAYRSGLISEGVKDLKTWGSELFRTGHKVATDNLTEKDRAAMEDVIKSELKENVTKLKEEAAKVNGDTSQSKAKPEKSPER